MALKRHVLPRRPRPPVINQPPKPMKVIGLARNQRGLRINCDGCYVILRRDEEGTIVSVCNTSERFPLHVSLNDDASVKVEAKL